MYRSLAVASLASIAMAQSTSVTSLMLMADMQTLVASAIGGQSGTATLAIQCPSGTPSDECGYPEPVTVTAEPTGLIATISYGDTYTVYESCSFSGTTTAVCSISQSSEGAVTSGSITLASSELASAFVPVTITAGLEKLQGSSQPTASSASASATGASKSDSSSTLASTSRPTGSPSGTASGGSAASTGGASHNVIKGASIAGVAGVAFAAFAL